MFQPENNAITIAVDDEHSIDDLVTLIAPHISSGQTIEGSGRFVYVVEWCCSEEVFQLVMSLSKYTGLAIDLFCSTEDVITSRTLIPEIITLNAAGISYAISFGCGNVTKAIANYIDEEDGVAAVLVGTSGLSENALRYLKTTLHSECDQKAPMHLFLESQN